MVENLSNASFRAILNHIQAHFADFLRLPQYKQNNLAEMALTELVKHQDELHKLTAYLYLIVITNKLLKQAAAFIKTIKLNQKI